MEKKYESRMEGDRWWPIDKSTTVDGRLVAWMEENGASHVSVVMADGWNFQVRAVPGLDGLVLASDIASHEVMVAPALERIQKARRDAEARWSWKVTP